MEAVTVSSEVEGVVETSEVLELIIAIVSAFKEAMADGKLSAADFGLLMAVFPKVAPALEKITEVPAELKDLDSAEAIELMNKVAEATGLVSEKVRKTVELAIPMISSGIEIVKVWKA